MDFYAVLEQVLDLLRRRGRVSYRALKVQFNLDDDYLAALKDELIEAQRLANDEDGTVLVWRGDAAPTPPARESEPAPLAYTPPHLTEKILAARAALEGERKQVTVLFADLKGSTELIAGLDPEEARTLLDPALHTMMDAVHRYEGTVNQVLGDGIMALFGAPVAHEDHAVRACYAALAMQAAMRRSAAEVRRSHGVEMQIRVGLNSGEVVVRAIGNDLHMDYSAVGQTTHLAARMEQLAPPGSVRLTGATLRLVEGLVQVNALGPVPVKWLTEPVEVFDLVGASVVRRRLQAAVARGLTRFVGRQMELETLGLALERAGAGHGQVVALVGEAGVGKSRLVYEVIHSHRTQGWRVLESASVSYGKATPYFPVIDLLKRYGHVEDSDDLRTIRAKVTGQVLTLDEALQEVTPALLALLDALPEDSPFLHLEYTFKHALTHEVAYGSLLQERRRTLHARIVEAIETLYPDRLVEQVERLVHHAFRGEVWEKAAACFRQAGAKAFARSAYPEAVAYFEHGLEALQHLPESHDTIEQAIDLRLHLRTALAPLAEYERMLAPLREAETLAETLGDQRRLGQVALDLSEGFFATGDQDRALECAQRALTLATALGNFGLQVGANVRLGRVYHVLGDYRRAMAVFETNISSLEGDLVRERFGFPFPPSVYSHSTLTGCLAERGDFAEGMVRGEEGVRIARAVDQPLSLVAASLGIGVVYLRKGDLDEAIEPALLCLKWEAL